MQLLNEPTTFGGLAPPGPAGGAHSASTDPLAGLKEAASRREKEKREGKRKGEGRREEGKRGEDGRYDESSPSH